MSPEFKFNLKKPCGTCPFRTDTGFAGSPDWLKDITNGFLKSRSMNHSCHETDPEADGFRKIPKQKQFCAGFLGLMKNEDSCISSEAIRAMVTGDLDWGKVFTKGIYPSLRDLIGAYLSYWKKINLLPADVAKRIS